MNLVEHLVSAIEKLLDRSKVHDDMLTASQAAQKAAEDKLASVEADMQAAKDKAAELEAKVEDLTAKLTTELDPSPVQSVIDKIEAVTGKVDDAEAAPTAPVEPEAPAPVAPTAPVVTEAPSGAMVTVDPVVGATTHEDATGTTTIVPHDGSAPTAVDAANQPVEPAPAAVAEAVQATADAGVTVPAPEAATQPVI